MNHRYLGWARSEFLGQYSDGPGCALWVGRTKVADDSNAMREAVGEHGPEKLHHERLIACIGILTTSKLCQCQSALGKRFKDQKGRLVLPNQLLHDGLSCINSIAGKACRTSDEQ